MNKYEWMIIGALAFLFFIIGFSTKRYALIFLTFLWVIIGALAVFFIMKENTLVGFALLIFWCIYPIGRSLRKTDD